MTAALLIRPSAPRDVAAMTAIYARHVSHGTGTFETDAPDEAEIASRRDAVLGRGLPWLVLESEGSVQGYAYAAPFRPRPAYRFCLEDSVYVAAPAAGRGFGRLLLTE